MNIVFLTTVLFSSISRSVLGLPFLTCRHVEPISTSSVQCSCYNPGGSGISWNRDGSHLTECFLSGEMCFNAVDYTFAVNSSSSTYMIEFGSYSYTNCSNVSCSDSTNPTKSDMKSISVDESQLTPKLFVVNEPSNHTDGIIIFTTDCLYKATATKMNVSAKWTAVTNKGEYILDVDSTISEIGSCQSCSYDFASNFSIDFHHKEDGEEIAQYRLQLYVDGTPIPSLNKTTNNFYNVKVRSETSPDSIWCLTCIIIIIIVVVTLYYVIVVIIWFKYRQEMKSSKASKCIPFVPIYGICYICGQKSKNGIPDPPTKLEVKTVTTVSITVSWKPGNDGGYKQTFYVLVDKDEHKVNGHVCEYVCTHLKKGTYYNISVKAKNDKGESTRTQPIHVRTLGVPKVPDEFQVIRSSISSITVTWVPGNNGGKEQTFVLSCSATNQPNKIEDKDGKPMFFTWKGLSAGTYYDLELCSENCYGRSTSTQSIKERTLGKPDPPTDLSIQNILKDSMTINWKKGFNGGYFQTFNVYDSNSNQILSDELPETKTSDMYYTLTNLTPSTKYKLKVISTNEKGKTESKPLEQETGGKPKPSTDLRATNIKPKSIKVKWKKGFNGGYHQCFEVYNVETQHQMSDIVNESSDNRKLFYECMLSNLTHSTLYKLKVISKNEVGQTYSSCLEVRTNGKPYEPTNFHYDVKDASITVHWNAGSNGGFQQHFDISIHGEGKEESVLITDDGRNTLFSTVWNDLEESSDYRIELYASNKYGNSQKISQNIRTKDPTGLKQGPRRTQNESDYQTSTM